MKNEQNPPVSQLRFVSRLLRSKATLSPSNKIYCVDHDLEIKNNFWSYVKHYMQKAVKTVPTFDKSSCYDFFKKSFKCGNPTKTFQVPS